MFAVLSPLQQFISPKGSTSENFVFMLHYKVTCILLVAFSAIAASRHFFGEPISCSTANMPSSEDRDMIEKFCLGTGTYSISGSFYGTVGKDVLYPGIPLEKFDEFISYNPIRADRARYDHLKVPKVYHHYYQWVGAVLFVQALAFYAPRYLWKMSVQDLVKNFVFVINNPTLKPDAVNEYIGILARMLKKREKRNSFLFFALFGSEFMNFANVVFQIYLTDKFLNGQFFTYAPEINNYNRFNQRNSAIPHPSVIVFPFQALCDYYTGSTTAAATRSQIKCTLHINNFNSIVFHFLWYWYAGLAFVSFLAVVYRFITICVPLIQFPLYFQKRKQLSFILKKGNFGDWLMLKLVCENIERFDNFEMLIQKMEKLTKEINNGMKIENEEKESLIEVATNSNEREESEIEEEIEEQPQNVTIRMRKIEKSIFYV